MTDFFRGLELELRAASEREPRRPIGIGQVIGMTAATALVVVALAVALTVTGGGEDGSGRITGAPKPDPVGTVIPKSETNYESRAIVVANGRAPISGPWQIEISRTNGERDTNGAMMWPKGYCSWLHLLDPPGPRLGEGGTRSGHCGSPRSLGFEKTPGFSRAQATTTSRPRPKEVLVWGRVPDRAAAVVITAPDGLRIEVEPSDGPKTFPGRYFGIPVTPGHPGARINWLDENGKAGSRGIRLMPPITR